MNASKAARVFFEAAPMVKRISYSSKPKAKGFTKTQGLMICCVEEIAYRMGYITPDDLRRIAEPMRKNSYGQYLLHMLETS